VGWISTGARIGVPSGVGELAWYCLFLAGRCLRPYCSISGSVLTERATVGNMHAHDVPSSPPPRVCSSMRAPCACVGRCPSRRSRPACVRSSHDVWGPARACPQHSHSHSHARSRPHPWHARRQRPESNAPTSLRPGLGRGHPAARAQPIRTRHLATTGPRGSSPRWRGVAAAEAEAGR
jgi:hypothetical protein